MEAMKQLARFDRQESMFRQGQTFQPSAGSNLGPVKLHALQGGMHDRPKFVGQMPPQRAAAPARFQRPSSLAAAPAPAPAPVPAPAPAQPTVPQEVPRHPAIRIAWGRLKKMDAQQLADTLADVIARMQAKNIPPGIIVQIQARLANFAVNGLPDAEVEITESEVKQMDAELLTLEDAEARDAQNSSGTSSWLIAVGAAIGIGLLVDWVSG